VEKKFQIGLAVLIQYRCVTDSQPPSHVAVASTRYAYASRSKNRGYMVLYTYFQGDRSFTGVVV